MRTAVLGCLALLYAWSPCLADTYLILPDGSGVYPTIQAAIAAASDGDIIELAYGTFTGDGNRDIEFLGKAVTVRSSGGNPNTCVIDCEGSVSDPHRGFHFRGEEGPGTVLQGVTITNGNVEDDFEDPWAGMGGAILIRGESSPTLNDLIISNNRAMAGGGLFTYEGSTTRLTSCRFIGNTAWWGSGGGMSIGYSEIEVVRCVFQDNAAHQVGGGIACTASDLTLRQCEFYRNSFDEYGSGGGLEVHNGAVADVEDCTFGGNSAGSGGAVEVWLDGHANLIRCTIVDNSAAHGGGVACDSGGSATLVNTIIAFSAQGEAVHGHDTGGITLNCCDLYGNPGGDWVGEIADQFGVTGNIAEDPLFCGDLNPEQPYTLDPASPCAFGNYPCSQIGAWPVGCLLSTPVETPLPGRVVLSGNFPDPFNPSTTVRFTLPAAMLVRLEVFGLDGRLVQTLASGVLPAGPHESTWLGRDTAGRSVASGTYLLRLEADGLVATETMALVR